MRPASEHQLALSVAALRRHSGVRPTTLVSPDDGWTDEVLEAVLDLDRQLADSYNLAVRHDDGRRMHLDGGAGWRLRIRDAGGPPRSCPPPIAFGISRERLPAELPVRIGDSEVSLPVRKHVTGIGRGERPPPVPG